MTELKPDKPLKRSIPNSPFYVKLYSGYFEVNVTGSKRPGVHVNWMDLLGKTRAPDTAPAKISNGLEYLRWMAEKKSKRKEFKLNK